MFGGARRGDDIVCGGRVVVVDGVGTEEVCGGNGDEVGEGCSVLNVLRGSCWSAAPSNVLRLSDEMAPAAASAASSMAFSMSVLMMLVLKGLVEVLARQAGSAGSEVVEEPWLCFFLVRATTMKYVALSLFGVRL